MIYKNSKLKEIAFPLGGIGTGSIGLAGNGALVEWEIFNRPNKGSRNGYSSFAIKAQFPDGKSVIKILQGDHTKDLCGQYRNTPKQEGFGHGPDASTLAGLPHFKNVTFNGKFPIATLTFQDEDFPATVEMLAFNPFIPLDADNSSIPAAFFQIKIKSHSDNVKYTVLFTVHNPYGPSVNSKIHSTKYTAIQMRHADRPATDKDYGDLTVAVDDSDGVYQEYWYRGRWRDSITTFWNNFSEDDLANRHYDAPGRGRDVCSVGAGKVISSRQSHTFRFALAWNVPNCYYYNPYAENNGSDVTWKNYYATLFADSAESCFYCLDNWDTLYKKTNRFCQSLHGATLDQAVIDAVSSTLAVLKSPTVLRLEDGTFYGWEGLNEQAGSCQGSCTHVWSYAYALCFLFPELERSLRDAEFRYDTDENGRMKFRTALPLGSDTESPTPCVDGQMSTVIKIYRDWKLTGNSDWLKDNWDNIQKILEYAWNEHNTWQWDSDKDGVLEGRQHHTLDMELFGPSSWLQGLYLAALKAASEMAAFLGDHKKEAEYTALFKNGYSWMKENLFNGKYFYHKVDLSDKTYTERFHCPDYWNEEAKQLKYQIDEGCEIDQMLGQWHANINGLGDIFDKSQRKTALESMLKNNFKSSMRDLANVWRVYALNDESGAIMCDYPEGANKPVIPITYCEECMTGFEYAFAGLLISEGFIEDGLKVVRAIRDRYDGEKRNPWNEIECGSNYARSMASFALLPIFSGFAFDMPNKHMGFSPLLEGDYKCMWNLGCGWGDFIRSEDKYRVIVKDGALTLKSIALGGISGVKAVRIDGKQIPFTQDGYSIFFQDRIIKKELTIEV